MVGGYILLNRSRKGNIPSVNYNPTYDMEENKKLPLGYRSNNPTNLRYNVSNDWLGKVTPPAVGKYGTYERFIDMAHGYRAALITLRTYIRKDFNTIEKIITRWAPSQDHNYTDDYIKHVSSLVGIPKDQVISRNDKETLKAIVRAMSISENGYKDAAGNDLQSTYGLPSMDAIEKGWDLL